MSTAETTDLAPRIADEPAPAHPQYMTGFDGMAAEPFPEAARKVLAEEPPPEAIEIKPDGIVFVPGVYYRRQLTRAFGAGGWALAPRGPARVMGDLVVYPGALYCLGRFVAEAVGECIYRQNSNMSYASCVEGAKTDALSRCCKDLGMATQLWDAAWRDRWKAEYAEAYKGQKYDKKKGGYVDATLWRLRSGRPVQDIDLMSGAGGVAPKAPAPSAPASAPAAMTAPATAAAPSDTGEPASAAQIADIRAMVKKIGWKGNQATAWLKRVTGQQKPEALSAVEATAAAIELEGQLVKAGLQP